MGKKIFAIRDIPIFNMYTDEEGTLHVYLVTFSKHIRFIPFALKKDEVRRLYELSKTNPKLYEEVMSDPDKLKAFLGRG